MKLREGEQRIRETKRERDRLEKKERQTGKERETDRKRGGPSTMCCSQRFEPFQQYLQLFWSEAMKKIFARSVFLYQSLTSLPPSLSIQSVGERERAI